MRIYITVFTYEIFGDFDDMLNELNILSDKYDTLIKIIKA